jgi:putative transposase
VIAWKLSNTLDGSFCLEMLDEALRGGRPEVFNTDQGVQFTAAAFPRRLESAGVAVSRDGGAGAGQHLGRAALEDGKTRGYLYARL